MAPALKHVWVLCEKTASGDLNPIEAHKSNEAALKAASFLSSVVEIKQIDLKDVKVDKSEAKDGEGDKSKAKEAKETATQSKKRPRASSVHSEDELVGGTPNPSPAKATLDQRKTVPEGVPDSLKGLKMLFTGTMEKDRNTCKATAERYGAEIVTKEEESDYIVLGTRPGANKLEKIAKLGLVTITESQFFQMIKTGPPVAKRARKEVEGDEPSNKQQKK